MTDNRKTTVPGASVGADAVQSSHKTSTNIITNSDRQINLQAAKKSNNFGLNTVSMTELYDTVYHISNLRVLKPASRWQESSDT